MEKVVLGLAWGDECKGSIVDLLTSVSPSNVVRFCGGSQCAHNVMVNGTHHTFSQVGASLQTRTKTLLSRFMVIDPLELDLEIKDLETKGMINLGKNVYISEECVVITPFQKICGQSREISRAEKHGTCGKGVGETVRDSLIFPNQIIRVKDLLSTQLGYKLNVLRAIKLDQIQQLPENEKIRERLEIFGEHTVPDLAIAYREIIGRVNVVTDAQLQTLLEQSDNVWEGAQGALLDVDFGFRPFVTKTNTTEQNAISLLPKGKFLKIGVLRAYGTRHGNGPFPTEDEELDLNESHNQTNEWQGKFRQGYLDLVLAKYAIGVNNGIDQIALTCLDKLSDLEEIKVGLKYEYQGNETESTLRKYFELDIEGKIIGLRVQKQGEAIAQLLLDCKPIYASMPGWRSDISRVTKVCDLPEEAVKLINYIEEQIGVPVSIVSVGPDRSQKMFLNDLN